MDKIIKQIKEIADKVLSVASKQAQAAVKDAKKAASSAAAQCSKAAAGGAQSVSAATAASAPAGPSRPMRFPYTFTAKIIQFPWVYYVKNNWVYRYYAIAVVACFPVFVKIHRIFNSPTNVKKWEEIKRKEKEQEEAEGHH